MNFPTTSKQTEVPMSKSLPAEPAVEVQPEQNQKLRPARTEYFNNDLTEEAKQKVIDQVVAMTKSVLAEPQVTVNSVSRMFGMEHNKVKASCVANPSLSVFVDTRDQSKSVLKIARSISKLTPEERQLLMSQFKE